MHLRIITPKLGPDLTDSCTAPVNYSDFKIFQSAYFTRLRDHDKVSKAQPEKLSGLSKV
jgi:hypothetical protein